MTDEEHPDEPEVGLFSIWFLRGALVLTALVVIGFGVHAATGLFDGDDEPAEQSADTTDESTATDDGTAEDEDPEPAADDDAGPSEDDGATADDDAGATDTDADAGSDEPAPDPAPGGEEQVQAFVDEAMAFIESTRGRAFVERPVVEVVSVETMTEIILDDIRADVADDPPRAAASLAFARSIGFFGADDELLDVYQIFVSGGVLGVYFPDTDRLLVRSEGELTLSTKATIVHELVHAFDDQHFDLERDELGEDGDVGWTFLAAVEGSASWVEEAWKATLTAEEAAALQAEALDLDPGDLFSLDFGFLIYQTSVYEAGREWLDARIETEGVAAIDDALVNGAASSEAVLRPLGSPNLEPVAVPFPAVVGEVLWQGRGGQSLIAALTFFTDPGQVASTGWGGDAMTVYVDPTGAECLRWDLVGDTETDTTEIFDGLGEWVAGIGGTIELGGGVVRVDRCA